MPVRTLKINDIMVTKQLTKREALIEQLKDLGVAAYSKESEKIPGKLERQELDCASEHELERIFKRKEVFKDSEYLPESKHVTKEANYFDEFRKSIADGLADQDENLAIIGDKTNYRGAFYRTGQPWIVEGDAK